LVGFADGLEAFMGAFVAGVLVCLLLDVSLKDSKWYAYQDDG
jgi:hypothetical protein